MKHKILASVLAVTMAMGMSMTAFAADTAITAPDGTSGIYGAELTGDSIVKVPTIKITVPSALSQVAINPYKMKYTVDSKEYTDQIVFAEQTIKNESDVAVSVNIAELKAGIESGSDAVIATAAPTEKTTTKSVFMYLELKDKAGTYKDAYKSSEQTQLLVGGTKASAKTDMIELAATTGEANFKLAGAVATRPAKDWTDKDKITVSLKFTFTPQTVTAAAP